MADYRPAAISKMFGTENKKRQKLEDAIDDAMRADEQAFRKAYRAWNAEMVDWKESVELANKILAGHPEAKTQAVKELNSFSQFSELGSSISFKCGSSGAVEASISIHGSQAIPSEAKSLLQSGRLSVKQMPRGRFNELYQDYVCSSVIRVANELFSLLPDENIFVTATDKLLNSATGHLEDAPIVSVCVSRRTLNSLNLNSIDPSDAMSNFVRNMSFNKTKGFEAVSRVDPTQFQK